MLNDPVNAVDPDGTVDLPLLNGAIERRAMLEIEKASPGVFSEGEKERMARELRKELKFRELKEIIQSEKDRPEKVLETLQDVFDRIEERIEKEGTVEDKKLLDRIKNEILKQQGCR